MGSINMRGYCVMSALFFAVLLKTSDAEFFTHEPQDPTVVVLGVNSSTVALQWNYTLPKGAVMRNFYIERYTDKPDVDFIAYKDRSSEVEKEPAYKDSSHFEILKPATLVINNATEADEFVYQFVANVRSKEGTSKPKSSAWLKVYAIPKILNISANQVVTQGEEVQLVCLAEGRPAPTVTWTRVADGARVKPSFRIRGRKDKAKYKCTASNGVGAPAVAYTELDVQYIEKPKILPRMSLQSNGTLRVRTNGTLVMRCLTEASPQANIKWLYNFAKPLPIRETYVKENVGPDDSGAYECVAENKAGTEWNRVHVIVVPLADGPRFAYNMSFRITHMCWNDAYENNSTSQHQNLSSEVSLELILIYGGEASFVGIKVLNFRAGSVLVDFQATFDEEIGENYALDALRNATKDGTLGKFKVEEDSPRLLGHAQSTAAPAPKTEQATGEVDLTPTRETPSSPWTDEGFVARDWSGASSTEASLLILAGSILFGAFGI